MKILPERFHFHGNTIGFGLRKTQKFIVLAKFIVSCESTAKDILFPLIEVPVSLGDFSCNLFLECYFDTTLPNKLQGVGGTKRRMTFMLCCSLFQVGIVTLP